MTVCVLADSHPDTFFPLTGKYDHCKISPPPSIYRSYKCSKRILMSLKIHTQLDSPLGSFEGLIHFAA